MAVAVSAIVAAAGAIGTEAFAGLAFTALADTGVAMSVVGAVTGDKSLMKAGAVMGLAGGIGSIATAGFGSAMDAASASDIGNLGSGMADASGAMDAGAASDIGNLGSGSGALASPVAGPDAVDSMTNLPPLSSQTGDTVGGTPSLSGAGGNVNQSGLIQSAQTPAGTAPVNPASASPVTSVTATPSNSLTPTTTLPDATPPGTQANGVISGIKDMWNGLDAKQKAVVLQGALAVPGGLAAQQNKARELALQQQRLTQTSYGTQVPSFGLINSARS